MTEEQDEPKFSLSRWSGLLTALTIIAAGISKGLRWSGFWAGFESTIFLLTITVIPLLVIFLAARLWSVICLNIFGKRRNSKWVKLAILSPAFVLLGHGILGRPTSPERFKKITGVTFPGEYSDTKSHHFGGGITDHSHTFVFITTPEETQRLIRDLEVTEQDSFSNRNLDKLMEKYPGGTFYHRKVEDRNWYYDLITDETRTKVWICLWGI